MMPHNYCSSSCAASVNNRQYPKRSKSPEWLKKYPRWPKMKCGTCGKEFDNRNSIYCSNECGRLAISKYRSSKSKYSQEQIFAVLGKFFEKYNRAPAKREVLEIVGCATNTFGSWTATIEAAGLKPHRSDDNRMYRRTRTKARDGHVCDSVSEALIDNWLTENKIGHVRNAKYPDSNHRADWVVLGDVFIEYFGLVNDSPRYDRSINKKREICKNYNIKLIQIYPSDLYPKSHLDDKLGLLIPAEKRFKKSVAEIKQSQKDFESGKNWKILNSLSDLG